MQEQGNYRELILKNIKYDILEQNKRMNRNQLDKLAELTAKR